MNRKHIISAGFVLAVVLLIAGTFSFVGCKEEPAPIVDSLTCKLDGIAWKATKSLTAEKDQDLLIINGVNAASDTLRILLKDQQAGTWPIKNIQNICILKKNGATYVPLNSADAALTITSHDTAGKLIAGSFYYTADDGAGNWVVVTGGSFRCTYQ